MSSHAKLSDEKVIAFTPFGDIHGRLTEVSSRHEITVCHKQTTWRIGPRLVSNIKAVNR